MVRLVRAMVALGLAAREDGQITLGPRIARLAAAADGVPAAGVEKLATLRDATGASAVRLHQRCGPVTRVCIAEVLDLHAPERPQLGVPVPLRAGPVTQTFLAWQTANLPGRASRGTVPYTTDTLAWTRRRGWAQGFSGRDHRVAMVAAPVLDRGKRVVAVLAISGPVASLTTTPGRTYGRALSDAASDSDVISECLHRRGEGGIRRSDADSEQPAPAGHPTAEARMSTRSATKIGPPRAGRIRLPREGEAPAAAPLVVGAYLRSLRRSRGMNGTDAAWMIRRSAATLSRMETGLLHRVADAVELLEYYGIEDAINLAAVEDLLQEPQRHRLFDPGPGWLDRLRACQRQAENMVIYSAFTIPDLARIPTYPADALTRRLRAGIPVRLGPRERLTVDNGEGITLLLDKLVLGRLLSEPSVMAAQLAHLRQLAGSERGPRVLIVPVTVPVIPPAALTYAMTLAGHDLIVEEGPDSVVYYTGEEAAERRRLLQDALALGVPLSVSTAVSDQAPTGGA
ncbi:hypothetical protein SMALB_7597 [Streptomyces malaysiensis]|uniref:IclR-ED domain-containing protein n=1 Tax=Streptomyces malaysiensis TaxID=92644 RepID=A0A7X6B0U1_STRMQ|nr:hypothetical protein [Streptomyces malaysiensis]